MTTSQPSPDGSGAARSDLLRRLASAGSVRSFDGRPVPDDHVRAILDVARRTGSARNRQPWRLRVVTDARVRAELARCGAYAQHLAGAPCVIVLLSADDGRRDTEFDVGRIAQTLTLAATALGLGSCLATLYPDEHVRRAARLVGAGEGWLPKHALSVGYAAPARGEGRSAIPGGRLTVDDLLS